MGSGFQVYNEATVRILMGLPPAFGHETEAALSIFKESC